MAIPKLGPGQLINHVKYFDENGDGKITPGEMYRKLRALDVSPAKSVLVTALTFPVRGPKTSGKLTEIDVANATKAILDTSTKTFDQSGQSTPARTAAFLTRVDRNADGFVSKSEVAQLAAEEFPNSAVKRFNAAAGFDLLIAIGGEKTAGGEAAISNEKLRYFYDDGHLFEKVAADVAAKRAKSE